MWEKEGKLETEKFSNLDGINVRKIDRRILIARDKTPLFA